MVMRSPGGETARVNIFQRGKGREKERVRATQRAMIL
jgi:hypothetical protein